MNKMVIDQLGGIKYIKNKFISKNYTSQFIIKY